MHLLTWKEVHDDLIRISKKYDIKAFQNILIKI